MDYTSRVGAIVSGSQRYNGHGLPAYSIRKAWSCSCHRCKSASLRVCDIIALNIIWCYRDSPTILAVGLPPSGCKCAGLQLNGQTEIL
jgi:hypothetical protein